MLNICICDSSIQEINFIAEPMRLKRVWGLRRDIINVRTESQGERQCLMDRLKKEPYKIVWEVERKLCKWLPFKILAWKLHVSVCSHPLDWIHSHKEGWKRQSLTVLPWDQKKRKEKNVLLLKGRKGLILNIFSGLFLEFSGRPGVTMWNHDAEPCAKRSKNP